MTQSALSRRDCRAAVHSLKARRDRWKVIRGLVRPRSLLLLHRRWPSMAGHLRRASRENRLLWWGPHHFVVLLPPEPKRRKHRTDSLRTAALWFLWLSPLLLAAGTVNVPRSQLVELRIALVLAGLALIWMVAIAVDVGRFLRRVIWKPLAPDELTEIDMVLDANWSVAVWHVPSPDDVAWTLHEALRKRPDDVILCPEQAISDTWSHKAIAKSAAAVPLDPRGSLLMLSTKANAKVAFTRPLLSRSATKALTGLGVLIILIGMGARYVADAERELCLEEGDLRRLAGDIADCGERPAAYWSAFYWLLNRVSGGDAEGLGAAGAWGRGIGLAVTFTSVVLGGLVIKLLTDGLVNQKGLPAHDAADKFNKEHRHGAPPPEASDTPVPAQAAAVQLPQRRSAGLLAAVFIAGAAVTAVALTRRRPTRAAPPSRRRGNGSG